jgi:ribonuclease VapC
MIVDTSALVAIFHLESGYDVYEEVLSAVGRSWISAATYVELSMIVDRERDPILSHRLDELLRESGIDIVPVSVSQARIAREAFRDFGRGSGSAAKLNLGDCFSYALAKERNLPLLFKGNDFTHTDLRSALESHDWQ